MTPKHVAAGVFACMACTTACGDDDGDGAQITTGLPQDAKLSSLDDADAENACVNVSKSFGSLISDDELERASCSLTAISVSVTITEGGLSGDVAECKKQMTKCLDGEEIEGAEQVEVGFGPGDESDCDDASLSSDLADCDATVSDYERCLSGFAGELRQRLAAITCDAVKDVEKLQADVEEEVDADELVQCEALRSKCPAVSLGDSAGDLEEAFEEQ